MDYKVVAFVKGITRKGQSILFVVRESINFLMKN